MEKLIIANHKMNLDTQNLKKYINTLKPYKDKFIICPAAIHIPYFKAQKFKVGIQNIYIENKGNYTGEISPKQAKDIGVDYAIIGHQERREIFNETNEIINKKIKISLKNNLKVIFCIGEKEENNYKNIITKQIEDGLKDIKEKVIISYEPLWAIGTNKTPSTEYLAKVVNYIKSKFDYDIQVLYGGSINLNTIKKLKEVNEVSGYLIGTASIDADNLIKIREVVK